jgi:hypothetical protein
MSDDEEEFADLPPENESDNDGETAGSQQEEEEEEEVPCYSRSPATL